jgi:homoserine dehydrogenase
VTVDVVDRPGVLATIAGVFGRHQVSIQSMQQKGQGDEARLIFVTHLARESGLRATIHEVRDLEIVERVGSVLRVAGGEE